MSPLAYASIGADSGLARQSASWYCFSASTPQKCFSRYASENFGNCNTRAACPVSNMFTTYTPKSRCNHLTSYSAPCMILVTRGSSNDAPSSARNFARTAGTKTSIT